MNGEQVAWLAGILEGEGYFTVSAKTTTHGDKYQYLRVTLRMTDRDVIERVAVLFGGRAVTAIPPRKPRWKWTYRTQVEGVGAAEMLVMIRPWMGLRRGERIDQLLACSERGKVVSPVPPSN